MAYLEAGSVLMRGYLVGGSGTLHMDIMADEADVVDTINIRHGSVTVQYSTHYRNKSVIKGQTALTLVVSVPDNHAFLEVLFHCNTGGGAYMDNKAVSGRSGHNINSAGFCLRDIFSVSKGNHTAKIISGYTGSSAHGFIVCRYIRATGSDNA